MNIEQLTKSQIVLLTLLVSFVTSIATGIVTVSLVDQAPPAITQSVSRVIQETVQSALPPKTSQSSAAAQSVLSAPPAQTPDLAHAVAKAQASLVRLYDGTPDAPLFLGLGIVIDASGTVVADYDELGTLESATAQYSTGTSTPMSVVARDAATGLVYLSPQATSTQSYVPAVLASQEPMVGDSVVALSGEDASRIAPGLVTALDAAAQTAPAGIDTSIDPTKIMKGSALINTLGEFLGLSTGVSRALDTAAFLPTSEIPLPQNASGAS